MLFVICVGMIVGFRQNFAIQIDLDQEKTMRNVLIGLSIFCLMVSLASAQKTKVVVIPLGDGLSQEQSNILEFFTYDAANQRLVVQGTPERPISDFSFQNMNVRGASQVRQDSRTNAPDIPSNFTFIEVEEEDISLGSIPNLNQAVLVHAFANFDTSDPVFCPCEFEARIVQDSGLASEVISPSAFLEVEAGDDDIDASISHSFVFISTAQIQNYSFQIRLFSHSGNPTDTYEIAEAGISISSFGLASTGVLKQTSKDLTVKNIKAEGQE